MFAGSIPALGTDTNQQRLGRQLADHLGLEPGMLWVRLPPEPLINITSSWSSWSARHAVNVEIAGSSPVEGAEMAKWRNKVDARHSDCRAREGVRVRLSPWLLDNFIAGGQVPSWVS